MGNYHVYNSDESGKPINFMRLSMTSHFYLFSALIFIFTAFRRITISICSKFEIYQLHNFIKEHLKNYNETS